MIGSARRSAAIRPRCAQSILAVASSGRFSSWQCALRSGRRWISLPPNSSAWHSAGRSAVPFILWENGFAVLKTDFWNGFNEISRQAVLNAVQERRPGSLASSNCSTPVRALDSFRWATQRVLFGAAKACAWDTLGSFGFDLALQAGLEQASQRNSLHVECVITDDAAIAVKIPDDHQAAVEAFRGLRSNLDDDTWSGIMVTFGSGLDLIKFDRIYDFDQWYPWIPVCPAWWPLMLGDIMRIETKKFFLASHLNPNK